MEQIKFRGKELNSTEWVYGYYFEYAVGSFIRESQTDGGFEDFKVDPKTVGQFTGLTDKNGEEIFSGDIVQKHYNGFSTEFTGVVNK